MSLKDTLQIMIVDDMAVSRGLLIQALEEIGIKNLTYEKSGNDAFSRIAAKPVHLVISDLNMPGMNGLELLENMRSLQSTRNIGFILVTGSPTPDVVERGVKLGLNNLVKKPFTTQGLKSKIESVVGRL